MSRVRWSAALVVVLFASCSFSHLDLDGRPCPCADGYVCVDEVCRREGAMDASVPRDAHDVDAPGVDAPGA